VIYLIIPTIALAAAAMSSYYVYFHAPQLADIASQHGIHLPGLAVNVLTLGPAVCCLIVVAVALMSMIPYFIVKRIAAQFILGIILLLISLCVSLILLLSIKFPLEKIKEFNAYHPSPVTGTRKI
jgi:hypothetical protein